MPPRRTAEAWTQYLNGQDRDLTLEEFLAREVAHLCAHLEEVSTFTDRTHLATATIDGRLDRLERFLEQQTAYRSTPALVGRDRE